jgi:hypothetical protein
MPFRSPGWAPEAYAYIRATWPYLNRSARFVSICVCVRALTRPLRVPADVQIAANQTRHFITLTCDHGPGDCE